MAVIPAFNEEKTIAGVLSQLVRVPELAEIVVVSDGSTDGTVKVADSFGVTVVELSENRGKGGAIRAGLDRGPADVVLFLDADLVGLNTGHVYRLLSPVTSGQFAMSVGVFENGRVATDLAQKVAPFLSGQRAVRKDVLEKADRLDISRFGAEVALTQAVDSLGLPVAEVRLENLTHVTKEEKLGVVRGLAARLKMYWEIIRYFVRTDNPM
jgi:glycosyltransferase involved in cell wall biosynthesis